jgi:hypothetical protein
MLRVFVVPALRTDEHDGDMLAGVLAFEIATVSLTMKRDEILGVGRVDAAAFVRGVSP